MIPRNAPFPYPDRTLPALIRDPKIPNFRACPAARIAPAFSTAFPAAEPFERW